MSNRKALILLFLFLLNQGFAQQTVWTLEMCLDTALANNAKVKLADLETDLSAIAKKNSRYEFAPTLNASVSQSYNFGRVLDPVSNEFTQASRQNTALGGSASLLLFKGMYRYYFVQRQDHNHNLNLITRTIERRNIKLQVLTFYLQALVNNELLKLNEAHLTYAKKQEERLLILVEAGNKVYAELVEIRSQIAQEELTKLQTENDKKIAFLRLKQTLQLKNNDTDFVLDTSYTVILNDTTVFAAIDQLPEVKAANEGLKIAQLEQKMSRSNYFPTLYLNAYVGTNYSDSYFVQDPNNPANVFVPNFSNQIDQNLYQTVSLSLNIPIFNQNKTKMDVELSKVGVEKREAQIEDIKYGLINQIQQLTIDIDNAKAALNASMKSVELAELDFSNAQKKYEEGIINYTELLAKKDRLYTAQSNFIQNKYNYYFKSRIKALYYE